MEGLSDLEPGVMTVTEEEPGGLQIGDWPALPPGLGWADDVDLDAEDPALVDSGRRICISTKTAGGRCGANAVAGRLVCAIHDGRADPALAAQARHQKRQEREERAETVLALRSLGTRAVVAEALAEKHAEIRLAIHDLAERAAKGDRQAALALIPWINQGLGNPTERVEHTAPGSAEELRSMPTAELSELVRRRRAELHAVPAPAAETA